MDENNIISKSLSMKSTYALLFILLLSVSSYFHHPLLFSNESCRYYLIMAVVDHNKLYVDDISTNRNDDLSFNNGHYYSAKAIGVPMLGIPVYWFIRNFTPLADTNPFSAPNIYVVRFLVTTLPFAFLGLVMFNLAVKVTADRGRSLIMVLAYSLGTIALNHSMIFSGHQTAASFCFFSFAIIFLLKKHAQNFQPSSFLYPVTAGIFAGIGALSDYTAMYIVILLVLYIFSTAISFRDKMFFIAGGIPFTVLLALYNHHCFENIFSLSYNHLTNEEFMNGAAQGFLGISIPDPQVLLSLLFSPSRGLFFIMPVLLYGIFGLVMMVRNKDLRPEAILIILIFLGYLLINGGFYGWHAGWTYGPRYLVPMLPFLAIPMAFAQLRSIWFVLLFFLSMFQVMLSAAVYFHIPQEFVNPLMEVIIPFISAGFTAINAGNLMGLKDPISFLPVLVLISILIALSIRLNKIKTVNHEGLSHKFLSAVLALFIVASLSTQFTKPEKIVHCYRAHLLKLALKVNALKKGIDPFIYEDNICNSGQKKN